MTMNQWIALMRGLNVGGHRVIKSKDLVDLFLELHFQEVSSHLQSGNILFQSNSKNKKALESKIEQQLELHFKQKSSVILLTPKEIQKAIQANPFAKQVKLEPSKVLLGFLKTSPDEEQLIWLNNQKQGVDRFIYQNQTLFVYCPNGQGRSKLPPFEKKLNTAITFRNSNVVNQLSTLLSTMTNTGVK